MMQGRYHIEFDEAQKRAAQPDKNAARRQMRVDDRILCLLENGEKRTIVTERDGM